MPVRKIKVFGVSDIFVNDATGGATAGIYANMAVFPDPTASAGLFAIDSSTPGGGSGTLYCAFGGAWCAIAVLTPSV